MGDPSGSSSNLGSGPRRDWLLEAGRWVAGVRDEGAAVLNNRFPGSPSLPPRTLPPIFPGVGLGAYLGVPLTPFDKVVEPSEGRFAGVETAFCAFRRGDAGRGSDGRDRGFSAGLAALPGPTD